LTASSAAIDAGTKPGVMTDFDGDPRPPDLVPDIGATGTSTPLMKKNYLPLIVNGAASPSGPAAKPDHMRRTIFFTAGR
jgi:hypothetical protein